MRRTTAACIGMVAAGFTLLSTRLLTAYEIAERSMQPTLNPGDWVLARRTPTLVRPGDVVVMEHPERSGFDLVKRVTAGPGEPRPDGAGVLAPGEIWIAGDNTASPSVDSRRLGAVPLALVKARVVLRYRPLPPSPIARR